MCFSICIDGRLGSRVFTVMQIILCPSARDIGCMSLWLKAKLGTDQAGTVMLLTPTGISNVWKLSIVLQALLCGSDRGRGLTNTLDRFSTDTRCSLLHCTKLLHSQGDSVIKVSSVSGSFQKLGEGTNNVVRLRLYEGTTATIKYVVPFINSAKFAQQIATCVHCLVLK